MEIIFEARDEDENSQNNSESDLSKIKKEFILIESLPRNDRESHRAPTEFEKKASNIFFTYVSCKDNYPGNYDNYVRTTLSHINAIQELPFEKELSNPKIYTNYPFSQIKESINQNKKLLLLDLDETLIHSEHDLESKNLNQFDAIIKFKDSTSDLEHYYQVGIFIRNGVQKFLQILSRYFTIGIFTASDKDYADAIIQHLDPNNDMIQFCLYRENCINMYDVINIKDLRIIKGIDLKKTVLIDNNMYSFAVQLSNGILINSFYGDKNDVELFDVLNYLMEYILPADDVREVNEKIFGFKRISQQL